MRYIVLVVITIFSVYAHGATGDELWRYTTKNRVKNILIDEKNGNIYFTSGNDLVAIDGHMGQEKWRATHTSNNHQFVPVAAGSRLLARLIEVPVPRYTNNNRGWFIFDPQTGDKTEILVLRRVSKVHALASDDIFYFSSDRGIVRAFDMNGKTIWRYELTSDLPNIREIYQFLFVGMAPKTLFATVDARVSDRDRFVIAIALERETGKLRWYKAKKVDGQIYNRLSISQSGSQKAMVIHGTLDPPELTNVYYRITARDEDSGEELWTKVFHPNAFTTVDDTILVFERSPISLFHVLNRNGTEVWTKKTEGVSFAHSGGDRLPRNHEDALVGHQLQKEPKKIVSIQLDSGEQCDALVPDTISAPKTFAYLEDYVARDQKIYVAIHGNGASWLWVVDSQSCQTMVVKKLLPSLTSPIPIHVISNKIIVPAEGGGLMALEL